MSDLENPAILKKYILVGCSSVTKYFISLNLELSVKVSTGEYLEKHFRRVVAVYFPTGRGPFYNDVGGAYAAYEFEYQGVRIIE